PDHPSPVSREARTQRLRARRVGNEIAALPTRKILKASAQETAEARQRLLHIDPASIELLLAGDHRDTGERSREQRGTPRLDLDHHGRRASDDIGKHAGVQDLVAETLLAPHQKRAVDRSAVPARLRIAARHQALGAGPAMLIERPALLEAAKAKAN